MDEGAHAFTLVSMVKKEEREANLLPDCYDSNKDGCMNNKNSANFQNKHSERFDGHDDIQSSMFEPLEETKKDVCILGPEADSPVTIVTQEADCLVASGLEQVDITENGTKTLSRRTLHALGGEKESWGHDHDDGETKVAKPQHFQPKKSPFKAYVQLERLDHVEKLVCLRKAQASLEIKNPKILEEKKSEVTKSAADSSSRRTLCAEKESWKCNFEIKNVKPPCLLPEKSPFKAYVLLEKLDHVEKLIGSAKAVKRVGPKSPENGSEVQGDSLSLPLEYVEGPPTNTKQQPSGCLICNTCGRSFKNKTGLGIHLKRVHSSKKAYICLLCDAEFSLKRQLTLHIVTHTGEKPHQCEICGVKFMRKAHLKRHMTVHSGVKAYTCVQCGKAFKVPEHLTRHIRIHTGERPYKCTQCDKTYSRWSTLRDHKRSHSAEKPFVCEYCGLAWKKLFSLQRHRLVHTGEKHIKCTVCDAAFSRRDHLNEHMKTHTGERPYQCAVCEHSFANMAILKSHVVIHSNEKPFSCQYCGRLFSRSHDVRNHMANMHSERKAHLYCLICNVKCRSRSNLESHMKICHFGIHDIGNLMPAESYESEHVSEDDLFKNNYKFPGILGQEQTYDDDDDAKPIIQDLSPGMSNC